MLMAAIVLTPRGRSRGLGYMLLDNERIVLGPWECQGRCTRYQPNVIKSL